MNRMDNLISRQAAIDAWKEDFKGFVNSLDMPRDDYKGIMEYIDELPSVQPDVPDTNVGDLISRQDAIDSVQGIGRLATLQDNDVVIRMSAVEHILFNLPSAQEIIRCKDCRHNGSYDTDCPISWPKDEDDFCSYSER